MANPPQIIRGTSAPIPPSDSVGRAFPVADPRDVIEDTTDMTYDEAFVEVCLHGTFEDAKWLLENGANVNAEAMDPGTEEHQTPLGNAVWRGHSELTQFLLENGADPNLLCEMGGGPLNEALTDTNYFATEILLEYGANPNIFIDGNYSPMHRAMGPRCIFAEFLEFLKENGGDFTILVKGYGTPLHEMAREGGGPQEIDKLRFCVVNGVDVNMRDEDGYTPLELAVRCNNVDTITSMLTLNKFKRGDRHRCLHLAAEAGQIEAAECLWENTLIDIHGICEGDTAIQRASDNSQWKMVDWLMAHGAGKNRTHSKSACSCETRKSAVLKFAEGLPFPDVP